MLSSGKYFLGLNLDLRYGETTVCTWPERTDQNKSLGINHPNETFCF